MRAFELRETLDRSAKITVVSKGDVFQFTPSNPWVAVGWRKPKDIEVNLARVLARRGVEHIGVGAAKVRPESNAVGLLDGRTLAYDYLVIATGPHLAFDEIEGMGRGGHTQSVCTTEHAAQAGEAFEAYCKNPGPIMVGAAQGASCFGPAYEFALILDTELKRRKIRHKAPMTFVTSEPYIGHLGLDGVGDTKGLLESVLRDRDIRWITNARVRAFGPNSASVEEIGDDGAPKKIHDVQYNYAMMLPAFRGVEAVAGVPGLVNPRGFVLVDRQQRNPTFPNVFAVGVCVAIPPTGQTPVPVGVPKTGFMIESMVTATAQNIKALIAGGAPAAEASWNAVCLADFGDGGVAFVAQPQIPPRNVNWSASGKWVHFAKIAFEKYFLRKIKSGKSEPFYERFVLETLGIRKLN